MTKRFIIVGLILVLVIGGLIGFNIFRNRMIEAYFANMRPPPVTVSATEAQAATWQEYLTTTGTLEAVRGVNVSPEVDGIVTAISFSPGQEVAEGDLLVQLDDAIERSNLAIYQAQRVLARNNLERARPLLQRGNMSQAEFDRQSSALDEAEARIRNTQATIDRKQIRAPFAGVVGIRQINLGQYLTPGTAVVDLQALSEMHVDFTVPEQQVAHLAVDMPVTITVGAYADRGFEGRITGIDPSINRQSRTLRVQATLPNPERRLLPGMFATVRVHLPAQQNVVTVPQTAVAYSLYGDSVFVVRQTGQDEQGHPVLTVSQQFVRVGDRRDNLAAILDGLAAGDRVVTSGQLRLQNGATVVIDNSVALTPPAAGGPG